MVRVVTTVYVQESAVATICSVRRVFNDSLGWLKFVAIRLVSSEVVCFSELNAVLGLLQNVYSKAHVCRRDVCYRGEPDLERLMSESRDPAELLWGWQEWRRAVGPPSRLLYPAVVTLMNQGARNNGYHDIGECWREELETPNLEYVVEELYRQVEPLYTLLHAVVRFKLIQLYGEQTVPPTGPIPAHLLGNLESDVIIQWI